MESDSAGVKTAGTEPDACEVRATEDSKSEDMNRAVSESQAKEKKSEKKQRKARKANAASAEFEADASASDGGPQQPPSSSKPQMTWYFCGMKVDPASPHARLLDPFTDAAHREMRARSDGFVPTTWEACGPLVQAAKADYGGNPFHKELRKYMCIVIPEKIAGGAVNVVMSNLGVSMPLKEGSVMFLPAVDMPPDVFTNGNADPVAHFFVKDQETRVSAAMCYWERVEGVFLPQ